ncbi:MAG: DegT/DnrJ/EryC1/StrS family aminotransferase, partial [Candidatus Micrarchaeia archaeon]
MDRDSESLKKEIITLARKYCKSVHVPKEWKVGDRIPYSRRIFDEEEIANLIDSSLEFWLTAGRFSEQFESSLSKWWGVKYCAFTNSGSSANLIALSAFSAKTAGERRMKRGDEIITTAAGFPTTVNPIYQNGGVPVFLDTEPG